MHLSVFFLFFFVSFGDFTLEYFFAGYVSHVFDTNLLNPVAVAIINRVSQGLNTISASSRLP